MENLNAIADFLFEVGILSKTPRSGFYFLGSGEQSVAEHINRVTVIGYVLSYFKKRDGEIIDENKDVYEKNPNAMIGICVGKLKSEADSSRIAQIVRSM